MAITWGGAALNVAAGTWSPSQGSPVINEIQLLPDPAAPTAVCSVLQQAGRARHKVRATVRFANVAAYNTLLGDMEAATSRTLADGDTVNGSYIIADLGDPKIVLTLITAAVTFVEA